MASSARLRDAVRDPKWQEYRKSMKGKSTLVKLDWIVKYYVMNGGHSHPTTEEDKRRIEDVQLRVNNYISALCRGGQLYAGTRLKDIANAKDVRTLIKREK